MLALLFLLNGASYAQSSSNAQSSSTIGHPIATSKSAYRHYKKRSNHRRTHSRSVKKPELIQSRVQHPRPGPMKPHVPHTGAGGEERSDWFYRRRAWPNETIDPAFYPNALAQAAKMPVLANHVGKDGALSTMQWQSIGPYSIDGRITCVATHPTDSNTFYVGAAAGGLWKTTNHGTSWTCVTDTFGSLSIGCVTLDPTAPETIYLGLGECNNSGDSYPGDGLWKSTDGGNSWQYLGFAAAQYIAKVLIDPRDHEQLFVASPGTGSPSDTNAGIFHSTNGGASWTRSLSGGITRFPNPTCTGDTLIRAGFIDLVMNPLNSAELVAFAWDHSLTLSPDFCVGSAACGQNTGVYRTTDTGHTWARIDTVASSGLPNGEKEKVLGRGALLWTADSAKTYLFAGYIRDDTNIITHVLLDENFEGLYRSTNEGVTWTKVLDSSRRIALAGVQGLDSTNMTNKQGGYDFYLAANPARPNEVYLGGIDVFRSTDFGLTFNNITNSFIDYYAVNNHEQHPDQHGLAFTAAASGSDMIMVSDGGVFHTDDFGSTWSHTTGLPITMFYTIEPWAPGMANTPATIAPSDLKLFGGTQDNGTVAHGLSPNAESFGTDSDFAFTCGGDGGISISYPGDTNKIISTASEGYIDARNTLDSLVPAPTSAKDTTHDTLPRWHTISTRLLYGSHALTDTNESCGFIFGLALDKERPTDLYTGRCHVYRAVIDWNDLENTKWYTWSPILAGYVGDDSIWFYGDIETIALGPRDASGNPMLWAGGYGGGSTEVWRTYVDPNRADTVAPKWVARRSGVPDANVAQIVPDRSDSLTAFLCTSAASNVDHVLKTTNGGTKWINISGNLPEAPVSAIVIDTLAENGNPILKNQCMVAGTDVGVYITTNGGVAWSRLGTGLPSVVVGDLKIYKNMLIAATHGRSLWALDISGIQAAAPSSVAETQAGSAAPRISIFPNPVMGTESFSVSVSGNDQPITSCRLIEESSGREFEASLTTNGDGSYAIVPSSTLSAGAYIVQLYNGYQMVGQGRISIVR